MDKKEWLDELKKCIDKVSKEISESKEKPSATYVKTGLSKKAVESMKNWNEDQWSDFIELTIEMNKRK